MLLHVFRHARTGLCEIFGILWNIFRPRDFEGCLCHHLEVDRERLAQELAARSLSSSPDVLDAFERFEEDLYAQNAVMNLTRVPREESWIRHILDSLLFVDLIPHEAELLDIGTGPGFPAWPIALVRPDVQVMAMDSSGKMLGFMNRHPLPNLSPVQMRAEECGFLEAFDVVTGRAVAPYGTQLELSAAATKVGGAVIPMRTVNELEAIKTFNAGRLGLSLASIETRPLPGTDIVRVFPVLRKVRPTPSEFPRRWADIKKRPL